MKYSIVVRTALVALFLTQLVAYGSGEPTVSFTQKVTFYADAAEGKKCLGWVKNAKEKHIEEIEAFTRSIVFNDLKPIILNGYADNQYVRDGHTDAMLEQWLGMQNMKYNHICSGDTIKEDERLIIAIRRYEEEKDKEEIVGVCQFERTTVDEVKHVFIRFLGVKEHMRKNGLGSHLLLQAMDTFDDVDACSLTTLAYANDTVHQWYEKRKFVQQGFATLDPRVPNSHYTYVKDLTQ